MWITASAQLSTATTHRVGGNLPAVGVHGGEEVDPGVVHQLDGVLVPGQVGVAQVVGQVEQELTAEYLGGAII